MTTFFTSDNHFGHKAIINFCRSSRIGNTVDEMNENMITQWNSQITPTDTVYSLGDFSFLNAENTEEILRRLNGRKHLIKGNHDHWITPATSKYFESISDYKVLSIDKKKIILFHFPIAEWDKMHYGSFHFYGHVHGGLTVPGRAIDVGIDAHPEKRMKLWTWEELDSILESREIRPHHNKTAD